MVSAAVRRLPAALAGGGLFEVGDAPVGGGEVVFEADDAGSGGHGHVLIEQRADPHRQREICPAYSDVARPRSDPGSATQRHPGCAKKRVAPRAAPRRCPWGRPVSQHRRACPWSRPRVVSPDLRAVMEALAAATKQQLPGPLSGVGSTLSGGSPTGYRRMVRETPNRVIAMRESNAPSPLVSQSAAITSSRRNNLLLRAQQIIERTPQRCLPPLRRSVVRMADTRVWPRPQSHADTSSRRNSGASAAAPRNPSRTTRADTRPPTERHPHQTLIAHIGVARYPASPQSLLDRCA